MNADASLDQMRSLARQALLDMKGERFDEAMVLLEEVERIARVLDNKHGIVLALGTRSRILRKRKQFDEAMGLLEQVEGIARDIDAKNPDIDAKGDLALALMERGHILTDLGEFDQAIALFEKAEPVYRELGNSTKADEAQRVAQLVAEIKRERGY